MGLKDASKIIIRSKHRQKSAVLIVWRFVFPSSYFFYPLLWHQLLSFLVLSRFCWWFPLSRPCIPSPSILDAAPKTQVSGLFHKLKPQTMAKTATMSMPPYITSNTRTLLKAEASNPKLSTCSAFLGIPSPHRVQTGPWIRCVYRTLADPSWNLEARLEPLNT